EGEAVEDYMPMARAVTDLMRENGISAFPLGVDMLPISFTLALQEEDVALVPSTPIVVEAGSVKTQDELEIYRVIAKEYDFTLDAFRKALRPGITENELAGVLASSWYEAG